MESKYDLVIIGAGAAGLIGAHFAARVGAKVALVDRARIGGDCTWTGCIPSKSLIHVAKIAHEAQSNASLGILTSDVRVDWPKVMGFVNQTIEDVYGHGTPDGLEKSGIKVFFGEASFQSPARLAVAGEGTLDSKNFLVCVGAEPTVPPIPGLNQVEYLTYLNLFELECQPKSLVVIGAGPIGLEMAQAFNRLGTRVTLIDQKIFAREEPEVGSLMQGVFESEGMQVVLGQVSAVSAGGDGVVVSVGDRQITAEKLLVSTGRRPRLEGLNLEAAGVAYSNKGIAVDAALRTSASNIFAAGDCVGSYQFSHFAGWQAFQAVRTALLPRSGGGTTDLVPWCTFTDPEVARVGPLEAEAKGKYGDEMKTPVVHLKDVDRAICEDDRGFIKLLTVGTKIVGATVVAARAGELINEIALAMKAGIGADKVAGSIHAYPTYSSALQLLATDVALDTFFSGSLGKIALRLSGLSPRKQTP